MKYYVVLGVLAMFLLVSCGEGEAGIDLTQPFIGGTIGLNTYLLEGLPPPFVQDNGQSIFSFAVVLENLGEADVGTATSPDVFVRLEGINPSQWSLSQTEIKMDGTLRGARKNFDGTILPGEITTVAFEQMSYLPNIRGNIEFPIRATVCYDYKNYASTKVCIKDEVLENIQDVSLCSLTGEKFPQNSGGPVHVTSLIQNPLSRNKIQINFVVEHVGFGQFYGRSKRIAGEEEKCNPSPNNFNKNRVEVIVKNLDDPSLTIACPRFGQAGTSDMVTLFQGAPQTISCTLEIDSSTSGGGRIFQEILEIELKYKYGQFIETPILVQDVSNEPELGIN